MSKKKSLLADEIQSHLFSLQDIQYKNFHEKLIPTVPKEKVIGVRVPLLRKYAKELFQEDSHLLFLEILPHKYYEEDNLHGFLIENIRDLSKALRYTDIFLPYIDNWSTCDVFSPKIFKKYPEEVLEYIYKWIASSHTYTIRYGIGLLLSNYLDEHFKKEFLHQVSQIRSEEYYVKMMIAWYFSTALVKQYDTALPYLLKKKLDVWTHNKTIQKSIESYRVSKETKDYLRTLKIK